LNSTSVEYAEWRPFSAPDPGLHVRNSHEFPALAWKDPPDRERNEADEWSARSRFPGHEPLWIGCEKTVFPALHWDQDPVSSLASCLLPYIYRRQSHKTLSNGLQFHRERI